MRIFLVRHGKDDENYRGGWSDLPLVDEGKDQARKLSKFLEEKKKNLELKK